MKTPLTTIDISKKVNSRTTNAGTRFLNPPDDVVVVGILATPGGKLGLV
jgi:hypothetical protein